MLWSEIKVGHVVRVNKGTRRGATTFRVTQVTTGDFGTQVLGLTVFGKEQWVWFTKSDRFGDFSVRGTDSEFKDSDDE